MRAKSLKISNPAIKGKKKRVNAVLFRREFRKLLRQHKTQNAVARYLGFKDSNESPLQSLLKEGTKYCDTHYADHLAKYLPGILVETEDKTHPWGEFKEETPTQQPTVEPSFITVYSDYNLFKVSESNNTLALVGDDLHPNLKAQLMQFKKHNQELFEPRKTWHDAKEALRECDRRWALAVGNK